MMRAAPRAPALLAAALCLASAAVCAAGAVPAGTAEVDAHGQLTNPALQARFESLTKQLRCLVCQNESIADSNASLAEDLRREVREMLVAGKSDEEILDFMTARYGEFVRFKTPLEPKTLLIWGSPFLLVGLGAVIVFRVTRARAAMPLDDEPATGL
jgi:cytochrome c-type biogenesis protein CcmH